MTRARAPLALALAALVGMLGCAGSSHEPASTPPRSIANRTPAPTVMAAPAVPVPACSPDPTLLAAPSAPMPRSVVAAVDAFVATPAVAAGPHGVSIWIEGYGEIAREPDRPLLPASNQKLLTAMGALAVLGADARLVTEVRSTADGGLVLVGGGDPTVTRRGPHSLDALAAQVRTAGITQVTTLGVDESRHDAARRPSGWQDWQVPAYAGPLSALMVDRNRYRGDPAFLADPALANGDVFRAALASHGVGVAGPTVHTTAPAAGTVVAQLTSAPIAQLVTDTLLRSDNMAAELLLREVGRAATGVGSTTAGAAAARDALAPLCVPITGVDDDGSGLSRADGRSVREWRSLLQAARSEPWWPLLHGGLPVAGDSGTLASRFRGTAAEGNVHAKTGTIIGGVALSGCGTTRGGRAFVFSVIANGPSANGAQGAVDALIAAVAAETG